MPDMINPQKGIEPMNNNSIINRILFAVTIFQHDICLAVNTLSQHMVDPRRVHWVAKKHILRYLKGTIDYGLQYL